jgi:hypothetical protein
VQCRTSADCAGYGAAVCQVETHVCVPLTLTDAALADAAPAADVAEAPLADALGADGGDAHDRAPADAPLPDLGVDLAVADAPVDQPVPIESCRQPAGCLPCAPGVHPTLLNACSDTTCVPFDNAARLQNRAPDGGLRPLPP